MKATQSKSKKVAKKSAKATPPPANPPQRRKAMVFVSLVGGLTVTSALLRALAPAPLSPSAVSSSLFAIGAPQSLDVLFDPATPIQPGRWKYIYVRQSRTLSGGAAELAEGPAGLPDHFVVGNGDGSADGEVQISQRWTEQSAPGLPPGLDQISPDCISICLVGDFDQGGPTPTQQRRLIQLLTALQTRLGLGGDRVLLVQGKPGSAGIGSRFPVAGVRAQILP